MVPELQLCARRMEQRLLPGGVVLAAGGCSVLGAFARRVRDERANGEAAPEADAAAAAAAAAAAG